MCKLNIKRKGKFEIYGKLRLEDFREDVFCWYVFVFFDVIMILVIFVSG